MYEGGPKQENAPIQRQQVVEAFKVDGKENQEAQRLFNQWKEQERAVFETMENRDARDNAVIESTIDIAKVLYEAGLLEEAWETLNDCIDLPVNLGKQEYVDQIKILMEEIEKDPRGNK